MSDFKIQLDAEINRSAINKQIDDIKKQLSNVKIDANIDAKNIQDKLGKLQIQLNDVRVSDSAISTMVSQINNALKGVNIQISNVKLDTNNLNIQAQKSGEQIGKNLGDSINKNLQASLNNVKTNINNTLKTFISQNLKFSDLSKAFNLKNANIDQAVIQQIKTLTKEINSLGLQAVKTNSDGAWKGIAQKISSLSKALQQVGTVRDLSSFKESLDVLDYFQNKKIFVGNKADVLANTGMTVKELNNQFRNLGVTFTTVSEGATKLDTIWTELFKASPNLQQFTNFGDQISAIVNHLKIAKEAMYSDSSLRPVFSDEVIQVLSKYTNNIDSASKKMRSLQEEQSQIQNQIAQSSTNSTNTVVQNEQKKQQEYEKTAQKQKQLSSGESIVKSNSNVRLYNQYNGAAREALSDFQKLLQAENAVISVQENFGKNNNLTSFIVNIKRATGEVESLKYQLENLGTKEDPLYKFKNNGATINSTGAVKQIQQIENAFDSFTSKIAQFKSNNEILSGLSKPLSDFENKLSGLKNGTYTINEVASAFNKLKTEASNITSNFSRQLSPIDRAISQIAKGEEVIKGLKAENNGLANSSKEVNSELNKCVSLLQNVKKIESQEGRTANWSSAYRQYADAIDNVKAKLSALKKEQSNSSNTQVFKIQDLKDNKIAYMSKVYNTIEKQMERINSMAKSQGWSIVDISGIEKADGKISSLTLKIRDAEGALKSLNMQRAQLQGNGKAQPGLMQVGDVKVLETASQAQTKLAQETEKVNAKLAEQAKLSISDGNISTQIETLSNGYKKLGLSADEVMNKIRNVTTEYNALESMLKSGASNVDIANQFNKMNSVLKQTQNDLKQTRSEYSLLATTQQRLTLANTIEAWNQKNTAATQQVRQANEQYIASLRDLNTQMTLVEKNNIATSFKQAENSMRSMGKLGLALKDQWKQAVSSFSVWLSASTAVMKVVSETRQAFTEIKEIDTLLTEISKTDWSLTSSDLKQIGSNAFSVASDYGKTATDYLSGVKDMSRAGYDNAEAMAELSVAAQGAGDMTSEVANKMVIATDKAYKMNGSVDELTKTLDGVNWICDNNAVSMSELSEGMSVVASTAASSGVGVDQLTAALGTMAAVTQQSGSEVARAFKAILLNIKQVSDADESIDAEGLTKYEKACNALGVSLKETKDGVLQTRDAMQVLEDLSKAYSKLDTNDVRRTNLLSSVGGKVYHVIQKCITRMNLIAGNALEPCTTI